MPILPFPQNRQATHFDCGAAALQGLLYYYGIEVSEADLVDSLGTNKEEGTHPESIVRCLQAWGFKVRAGSMTISEVEGWIDQRVPVVLDIQAWPESPVDYSTDLEDGHYVVAIGYDDENLYFEDPSLLGNIGKIPRRELDSRWHDTDGDRIYDHFGIAAYGKAPQYDPAKIITIQASRVARRWMNGRSGGI